MRLKFKLNFTHSVFLKNKGTFIEAPLLSKKQQ